jgi:hypothetical protein
MAYICDYDVFFVQHPDYTRKFGLFSIQKCTIAFQKLGYGIGVDYVDEYYRLGESTAMECLKHFA